LFVQKRKERLRAYALYFYSFVLKSLINEQMSILLYSHLSNNLGGWNKRGGWDFLEKKLVHKCNKRGVKVEKYKKSINVEGEYFFCGWWNFSKSVSMTSCLLER
jgi:hypothetical protein